MLWSKYTSLPTKKKKNVTKGNSILKPSSLLKLLFVVILLIVYLLHDQCFSISPVWESVWLESADRAKQAMLSYRDKFTVLSSALQKCIK